MPLHPAEPPVGYWSCAPSIPPGCFQPASVRNTVTACAKSQQRPARSSSFRLQAAPENARRQFPRRAGANRRLCVPAQRSHPHVPPTRRTAGWALGLHTVHSSGVPPCGDASKQLSGRFCGGTDRPDLPPLALDAPRAGVPSASIGWRSCAFTSAGWEALLSYFARFFPAPPPDYRMIRPQNCARPVSSAPYQAQYA